MLDYDLSLEQASALCKLTDTPRPLALLIVNKPPFSAAVLRACDYTRFLQAGWIEDTARGVALTESGLAVQSALMAHHQRFAFGGRFEIGDLVTITHITPFVGRNGHVLHWVAQTDSEYHLKMYPEDFKALIRAGYDVPAFKSRTARDVSYDVYVSREQDAKTGWRIAEIKRIKQEEWK